MATCKKQCILHIALSWGCIHSNVYLCTLRAGRIVETFSCPTDGMLKIASITAVDGREQHCIQVRGSR